jgi:glycosyltransferase involved in cell wall biosynthesis
MGTGTTGRTVIKLSALVCVHNQDAQLAECLRRLSFCDEIVVVADRCTDRSQEVARRAGAILLDGIFPLESQRRQAGVEACSGDWVLEIDPDEIVDAALAWEIRWCLQARRGADWFEVPIDNFVGDELLREGWTGALSANAEVKLYKRGLKAWEPRRVNAPSVVAGRSGGALKGAIRRTVGQDVGQLVERLHRLAGLAAEDLADSGRIGTFGNALARGAGAFLKGYVLRRGWREGRLGLLVAWLSALYPVLINLQAGDVLRARAGAATDETARVAPLRDVIGVASR